MLQIGAALFYYKLGQRCYKLGQLRYCKLGQVLLQIGAKYITNWGRYYKLGQLLEIGA